MAASDLEGRVSPERDDRHLAEPHRRPEGAFHPRLPGAGGKVNHGLRRVAPDDEPQGNLIDRRDDP